jgi:AraC-like DNA-binding protein
MKTISRSRRNTLITVITLFVALFCVNVNASEISNITSKGDKMLRSGDYPKAIACYSRLIQNYKKRPCDYQEYATALKKGGNICCDAQRFIEALEFFTLGMDAAQKAEDNHLYLSCMGNIGTVYGVFSDYERALYYFKKVYYSALKCNENDIAAIIIMNIVRCYCYTGNTEQAKKYFLLQTQTPMKDEKLKMYSMLYNQGLLATAEKNISGATFFFKKALLFSISNNMPIQKIEPVVFEIGKSYYADNNMDSAKIYLERCVKMSNNNSQLVCLTEACKLLAELYKKEGDTELAAKYDSINKVIDSSIYSQKKFSDATNQLYKYEDRASTEKINSLNKKVNVQLLIIIAFIILILGLVSAVIVIYLQKKKQDKSYRLLINKEQERAISHYQSKQLRDKYLDAITKNRDYNNGDDDATEVTADDDATQNSMEDRNEELIKKISMVMDDPQFIFSPDFSLSVLCREVASNTKYVSKAINDTYKKNFKTLVNEYRIREAMKRLGDSQTGDSVTISGLALSLGYNSSTSFIISFKKIIGMTPAVYRKLLSDKSAYSDRDADEENGDNL